MEGLLRMIDWGYLAIIAATIYAWAAMAFVIFGWAGGLRNARLRALMRKWRALRWPR
jgi:hypothetical protein